MKIELFKILDRIGKKNVSNFIESVDVMNSNESISKMLGNLMNMNNYSVYCKNGNKITSITLRDILSARDVNAQKLGSMAKITPNISKDSNIERAASIMSHYRLRSIPVIEDDEIIGQVTTKSILKSMGDKSIKISSTKIMTPNPIRIKETDFTSTAKNIMVRNRIDHIPIVEENLSGIITSFNIAKIILTSFNSDNIEHGVPDTSKLLGFPVKGIAERNVERSSVNDSVAKIIQSFNSSDSTYSIVTLGNEVQGIITHRDVISLLGERVEEEIPAYIIGLPDDPFISELAKMKFNSIIKFLKKAIPDLEEARCRIKLINTRGKTKRYEIDISLFTTTERYHYTNGGLDLAIIFDQMKDSLKNKLSKMSQKRQKKSRRYNSYTN